MCSGCRNGALGNSAFRPFLGGPPAPELCSGLRFLRLIVILLLIALPSRKSEIMGMIMIK